MPTTTALQTLPNPIYHRSDWLSPFDKIHLAALAVDRALEHTGSQERFHGEYLSAQLWRRHDVS